MGMRLHENQSCLASYQRLEVAMNRVHMSNQDLAKQVTFSRQYLYKIIKGEQDLMHASGRVLIELGHILGVSTDFLLGVDTQAARDTSGE
jgi:plasmid maintenance system antidote protein VapI